MFCQKCGNEVPEGVAFCGNCGAKIEAPAAAEPKTVFCNSCGNQLNENEKFCGKCGVAVEEAPASEPVPAQAQPEVVAPAAKVPYMVAPVRCVAAFVLGIIAASFGTFGGLCMTVFEEIMEEIFDIGVPEGAFFFVFCGSIAGLVGAILCMSKARIGSIILAGTSFLMSIYVVMAYSDGAGVDFFTLVSYILFMVATLVGALNAFIPKKQQ